MPNDVLSGEISEEQFHYKAQEKRRSAGDPRDGVAEILVKARRPVLYAGQGACIGGDPVLLEMPNDVLSGEISPEEQFHYTLASAPVPVGKRRMKQAGAGRSARRRVGGEIRQVRQAWIAEWMPRLSSNDTPISPYRVVYELNARLDKANSIVTHDSGNPRDQIVPFYAATTPRGYIGWGNSTQLGTGLGYAMGAKVAFPDKTCVNLMGDVAVGMAGTDFETAAREKLGIITVIVNNGAMGGYEKNIPVAVERYGSKYVTGEYARMAESLGAYAEKITDPGEVGPAIERAKEISATGQPCVLEIITREEPVFSQYYR